jgi:hypothetical protein
LQKAVVSQQRPFFSGFLNSVPERLFMQLSPLSSSPFDLSARQPKRPSANFGTLSPGLLMVDGLMKSVQQTRAREMIIEDIMGYGILRSGMDYIRPWIYGRQQHEHDGQSSVPKKLKGNMPAARERILREVASIATDCISPGIIAYGVAKLADNRSGQGLSRSMINDDTLRVFRDILANSSSRKDFAHSLAKHITENQHKPGSPDVLSLVENSILNTRQKPTEAALAIAKQLGRRQLDVKLGPHWFELDAVLSDAKQFLAMTPKNNRFRDKGLKLIQSALKASPWKVFAGVGGALFLTFAVPYMNVRITRKLDKLVSYPAEMGLRKPVHVEENSTQNIRFSFVHRQLKEGKYLPLITSLIPLGVVIGALDTVKLSNGQWRKAFMNPFKGGLKGFIQHQTRLNQFSKSFPFTSQQQIASLYAALITSRLLFSRSDIEFRERLVDSVFLGWMVWILGTPFMKRTLSGISDKRNGTMLLKQVGNTLKMRTEAEVKHLLPKGAKQLKTLASRIRINAGSLATTMVVLGIIEPLIAMKWSMWQAKRTSQSQ